MKVLILTSLFISNFALATSVRVQSYAEVSKSKVTLGDVAAVNAESNETQKNIENIPLGESPEVGSELLWTAADVSQKLRSHSALLNNVEIKIPEQVTISRVTRSISSAMVKEKISEAIRTILPDSHWEFEVTEIQLPATLTSVASSSFQIVPLVQRPKGASTFELIIDKDGKTSRFWITARVKYWSSVAVLTRQIDAHTRVTDSDVRWQRRDVTYLNDVPVSPSELNTATSKFTLSVGSIVYRSQLEREMALKFGQQVDLVVGDENFNIVSKGVAQQGGFIGDVVRVRSEASNKIVDGVVASKGVVNVRF